MKSFRSEQNERVSGDQLLFTRSDEVERLWERAAPILSAPPSPLTYARGGWGPQPAAELALPTGWRLPETA